MKELKVKKVTRGHRNDVYDLNVDGSHHYILENGVVSHNSMDLFPKQIMSGGTGIVYSASTIVMLSKAKHKTGKEDSDLSLGQSGIVVTAKSEKNRLAKPAKIKFVIDFEEGCNPYYYLEHFCTPENFSKVGIAKGKMEIVDGEEVFKPGGTRWYIRHLGKSIFAKDLYTPQVFTQEVLEALDPIIANYFSYSSVDEATELEKEFLDNQKDDDFKDIDIDDIDGDLFE